MWLVLTSIALSADVAWYADTDEDGFGDGGDFIIADQNAPPDGYVRSDTDCNDNDEDVSPDADESCNAIDDDCDGIIDGAAGCSGCTYGMFEDHQYAVCGQGTFSPLNWRFARDFCRSVSDGSNSRYDLASIASAEEDAYILGRVRAVNAGLQYWIGLNDRDDEAQFEWSDGTPFDGTPLVGTAYRNWNSGEPNNSSNEDCVATNAGSSGRWNDARCTFSIAPFVCEATGDPRLWWPDEDTDGFGNIDGPVIEAHAQPAGYAANAADCDDDNTAIKPGTIELCNGIDDNCNGIVDRDSDLFITVYNDPDGDGFGSGDPFEACADTDGLSAVGTDCLEGDPLTYPNADELCNGVDNDCDGNIDNNALDQGEWYADGDSDGYGSGAPRLACSQPTGAVVLDGDCDDNDPNRTPFADEICDNVDNDCDEVVDEDPIDPGTWFVDGDGDDFGDSERAVTACDQPDGSVLADGDCDDDDPLTYPGAPELEDGLDNDCDGFPEDVDPDTDPDSDSDSDPDSDDPDTGDVDTDGVVTSSRQFEPSPSAVTTPSGCSCSVGAQGPLGWAALGLAGLLAVVRRRTPNRG